MLAGPWAGQILADLGAEVIKIEHPRGGDETRAWGPPFVGGARRGMSAYFLCANRNKKSLALDLAQEEGQEIARRLALQSDIVIENFKVGGLKKYRLDYPSLREINPALIYCSITGFGQSGPEAARPGYDNLIQAEAGLMSITGEAGGRAQKVGVAVADLTAGLYAAVGVLAALARREKTGAGQHLDIALFDSQVAVLANQALNYLVGGAAPARMGGAHPNIAPYQPFAAADGEVMIAAGNDAQFQNLCAALNAPALAKDKRFADNAKRVANRAALIKAVAAIVAGKPRRFWLAALRKHGVPCAPINDIGEVFQSPQSKARRLKRTIKTRRGECVPTVASPLNLSATPPVYRLPPPRLGQHSRQILRAMGASPARIRALQKNGVIAVG